MTERPIALEGLHHVAKRFVKEDRLCVYFLISEHNVVYVGQSKNLESRIKQHRADKQFDDIYYIEIDGLDELPAVEQAFIRFYKPKLNASGIGELTHKDKSILARYHRGTCIVPGKIVHPKRGQYCDVRILSGPYAGKFGFYDDDEDELIHTCDFCEEAESRGLSFNEHVCDDCTYQHAAIVYAEGESDHYYLYPLTNLSRIGKDLARNRMKERNPEFLEKIEKEEREWNAKSEEEQLAIMRQVSDAVGAALLGRTGTDVDAPKQK